MVLTVLQINKYQEGKDPSHNISATYEGSYPEVPVSIFPEQWEMIYLTSLIESPNIPDP